MMWSYQHFIGFLLLLSRVRCEGPPRLLQKIEKDHTAAVGSKVKLWCRVSGVNDSPHNRTLTAWQRIDSNGTAYVAPSWKRFTKKAGRYLKINNVQLEDSATYVCIATNEFGQLKEEIKLTVIASNSSESTAITPIAKTKLNSSVADGQLLPTFRKVWSSNHKTFTIPEGKALKLRCKASGDPKPETKWKKDGRKLSKVQRSYRGSSKSVLSFQFLLASDAGTYTCIVQNKHGAINRTFIVRVIAPVIKTIKPEKPEIKELRNMTAIEGDDVTFTCATSSAVKPAFRWLKWSNTWSLANYSRRNQPFAVITPIKDKITLIWEAESTNPTKMNVYVQKLRIENLTGSDAGKYTCHVRHSGRFTRADAFLVVRPKGGLGSGEVSTADPKVVQRGRNPSQTTEIPLAVFIGIPLAFVVVLIVAIIWCYFQIKRHRTRFEENVRTRFKENVARPTSTTDDKVSPHKLDTAHHVDKSAYAEYPHQTIHCQDKDSSEKLTMRSSGFDELITHRTSIDNLHSHNRCCQHSSGTDHSSESLSSVSKVTAI